MNFTFSGTELLKQLLENRSPVTREGVGVDEQ